MACLLVPVAEAVAVTAVTKALEMKEAAHETSVKEREGAALPAMEKLPFSRKLKWLSRLLWGGSALLALEHVWHGEIVPWFPFLTAAADPEAAAVMLHEMATVGTSMAALVTAVWGLMLLAVKSLERRGLQAPSSTH